jgi:tol-pal system protein YbgF
MLKFRTGYAASLCLVLVGLTGSAGAEEKSVEDRLERLERDLNQLQRQVYRSQVNNAPTPSESGPVVTGSGALDIQIRMDQIEAQMRAMTGKLEENQYAISKLSTRVDKMQGDDETRFQQLESGGAGSGPASAPPAAADPGQRRPVNHGGAGNMDQPASSAGYLEAPDDANPSNGKLVQPEAPTNMAVAAPPSATPPSGLAAGTVQDQYNAAFGLLRSADYHGAEVAFKAFLKAHGTDPLAANAQYWLGETYFVRGDFTGASAAFADGYQKYPQGPKAADNLLKLGMSLGNQGRKQDACFAFARLERDFPTLAPALKEREANEKKHFGC